MNWPSKRRLGPPLTLGLLASLAALGMFGLTADGMTGGGGMVQFDSDLASRLHEHASNSPAGVTFFKGVTSLGGREWIVALAAGIGVLLLLRSKRLLTAGWLMAIAGAFVLDPLLKNAFQRTRPSFENPIMVIQAWSFPSGHALGSLVAYGMLAYLLVLLLPQARARTAAVVVLALLVLAIGFSRLYLGVHYFSDVVAGFAAGGAWLALCITGVEVLRRPQALAERGVSAP